MPDFKIRGVVPEEGTLKMGSSDIEHIYVGATHVWPPARPVPILELSGETCCTEAYPVPILTLGAATCCTQIIV